MRKLFVTIAVKMNTSTKEFLTYGLCERDLKTIADKGLLLYVSLPPEIQRQLQGEFTASVPTDVGDRTVTLLNCFQGLKRSEICEVVKNMSTAKKQHGDVEKVMNVDGVEPSTGKKRRDGVGSKSGV